MLTPSFYFELIWDFTAVTMVAIICILHLNEEFGDLEYSVFITDEDKKAIAGLNTGHT